MWRGVKTDLVSLRLENGSYEMRHASLAVGAGDMNGFPLPLGIAEMFGKRLAALKPRLVGRRAYARKHG